MPCGVFRKGLAQRCREGRRAAKSTRFSLGAQELSSRSLAKTTSPGEDNACMESPSRRPRIAVTSHLESEQTQVRNAYIDAIWDAGGIPVVLAPLPNTAAEVLSIVDGVVMTGGDDPDMRLFGEPLHPKATLIDPRRQAFELELLDVLDEKPDVPLLAICLGMQLMGLHAGAALDQHLPDHLPTAAEHWNGITHPVEGTVGCGHVYSHHRQALRNAGTLSIVGTSPDGVIEAIADPSKAFRLGVQWHPERTSDDVLGCGLFKTLVQAAGDAFR
jgi:putative glutamine amidotransferase